MKSQIILLLLVVATVLATDKVKGESYEGYKLFEFKFHTQEELKNFLEIFKPDESIEKKKKKIFKKKIKKKKLIFGQMIKELH